MAGVGQSLGIRGVGWQQPSKKKSGGGGIKNFYVKPLDFGKESC